ncbi:MAG: serine/threonine protein kinase [Chitinispirillaceae bacterium]|nr:serine/threonine protein kinase [Chitinispirillaceae bacterium]
MESHPETSPSEHIKMTDQVVNPYRSDSLPLPKLDDKIGPNKVQAIIGEGGSAQVYKVWHEGLEVVRAVKVLKKYSNKEARERFLTEAKILADIHHPNIIEIHNIGFFTQQIPFIEMEYVEGLSIKTLLSQTQRLPLSVAISIGYYLCQALHYAHTKDYTLYGKVYRGLIHRDIKPENIFISKDGIVKLMDFGIARPSEVSLHTVGAKIMGTLVYLSPEQLNGTTLDHRSDIFSLGTVLYEMIAGKRAFPQKTLTEIVQKKTKGIYVPLHQTGIKMPAKLSTIIDKSMALDPADRYPNIADFGHDLFKVLRLISDHSPHEIIMDYQHNPESIPVWTPGKENKSLNPALIIGAVSAGIILLWGILKLSGVL